MPTKTVHPRPRCLICNCSSHHTVACNSNMNGRRSLIQNMRNCMMDDIVPDFNSFPINELRFIVLLYQSTIQHIMFPRTHYSPSQITTLRTDIPLTLPKTRMVKELVKRWSYFSSVRKLKKMIPNDGDECPICMECMEIPIWNDYRCRWDMMKGYRSPPNALFTANKVRTECGHEFCCICWERHIKSNHTRNFNLQNDHNIPLFSVRCPLCRHQIDALSLLGHKPT